MSKIILEKSAVEDLEFWSKTDMKLLKKIVTLIGSISDNPFSSIGKPEPLKGNMQGYWSRRIDSEHRIIYAVTELGVSVIACRYHYK